MNDENNIKIKFAEKTLVTRIIELLNLTNPKRVVPIDGEFDFIKEKLDNDNCAFTDEQECSTVALSSNPTSFSSCESADEYFLTHTYSFVPNNFKMLSLLGSGSFGSVFLAEYAENNNHYAIKKLPKSKIDKSQVGQIMDEKKILEQMNYPFVLQLYGTFQTDDELCFVTEVVDCGDLFSAIYYGDERLSNESCVFYGACVTMGLEYIHQKNIVFRDLKPENIMIDSQGYPKIIDFGLAKQLPFTKMNDGKIITYNKCRTLCGTPEYVSPEIILNREYDRAVDLWALGVMIYEMLFRRTPFVDDTNEKDITKIFTNIVYSGKNGIVISNKIDKRTDGTANARNLVTQLLNGDETKRKGTASIIKHPYFATQNVDDLYNRIVIAPIIQPQFEMMDISLAKPVARFVGDQKIFIEF